MLSDIRAMKMFKITELDSRNHIIKNTEQKKAEEMFGECFWRAYRISVQFSVEPIITKKEMNSVVNTFQMAGLPFLLEESRLRNTQP